MFKLANISSFESLGGNNQSNGFYSVFNDAEQRINVLVEEIIDEMLSDHCDPDNEYLNDDVVEHIDRKAYEYGQLPYAACLKTMIDFGIYDWSDMVREYGIEDATNVAKVAMYGIYDLLSQRAGEIEDRFRAICGDSELDDVEEL